MQISLNKGQARVKLTKSEQRTLVSAQQILEGIAKFEPNHVASAELELVIKQIDSDGVFVPSGEASESDERIVGDAGVGVNAGRQRSAPKD